MKQKLDPEAQRMIRQAASTGTTRAALAKHYGVSPRSIQLVLDPERYLLATIRSARRRLKKLREEQRAAQAAS
jgi:hypothetical protein